LPKQMVIVLDNPPLESDAWATEVFNKGSFKPVENEAVAQAMTKDPAAKKALLEVGDPIRNAEKLAPHYKKAFDALYAKDARVGLYGTAWLVYQKPIDACIVDWSQVEKLAKTDKQGAERVPYDHFKQLSHDFVRARAKKYLAPDRYLELPLGLTTLQKVEKTLEFLRKLQLVK
jgi:hypothetical protein